MNRLTVAVCVVLCVALCLVSACANAQPHVLSLWGSEEMFACDVLHEEPNIPFDVYVFIDPGPDGVYAVEYKLEILPGHYSTQMTIAPIVSGATVGSWIGSPGISAPFNSCQTELTWIVNLTMVAPDIEPGFYTFGPNDHTGAVRVGTCADNRPFEPAEAYNVFGYNESCMWYHANETSSWGAIKSLFND